jgi:hypothetical protein
VDRDSRRIFILGALHGHDGQAGYRIQSTMSERLMANPGVARHFFLVHHPLRKVLDFLAVAFGTSENGPAVVVHNPFREFSEFP